MQVQQNEQPPDTPHDHSHFPLGRVSFVMVVLLSIAVITTIWIFLGTDAGIVCTILFVAFGAVFAFLQLTPSLFSKNTGSSTPQQVIIHTSSSNHDFTRAVPLIGQNTVVDATTLPPIDRNQELQPPTDSGSASIIWEIPYRRNPFFSGREQLLSRLHDNFTTNRAAALTQSQAISGLGGIGKTQIAIEYAYRYQHDYQYILWVSAASRDTLLLDFVALASLLNLPEQKVPDQHNTIAAVKHWLATHDSWLLILDNADDLAIIPDFIPPGTQGHILITTRVQTTGTLAKSIEIHEMDKQEGILLLLRRARRIAPEAQLDQASEENRVTAAAIVVDMAGLPLALDQAGAFIEETQCSLSEYLHLYRTRQEEVLHRRGSLEMDYPDSVMNTWSLSFEKIEQDNPTAADVLRLLAFLDPDVIPENMITQGADELGQKIQAIATDSMKFNEVLGVLRNYSLIRRNDDYSITIHRLVQVVLKYRMNKRTRQRWAERAVRVVNKAFPQTSYENWTQCQQYIPQVLNCAVLINRWEMTFPEASQLLNNAGTYLSQSAQYEQAEFLLKHALTIRERVIGPDHPETATSLHNLAKLFQNRGMYKQAEPLYLRALAIRERVLGPDHPDTANCLNNLGWLYWDQGKNQQAELPLERSLTIRERVLGLDHPDTAASLNDLGVLYVDLLKAEQAEPLFLRALAIRERILGPDHHDTAITLNNLAIFYDNRHKYKQAEPLYLRALDIRERVLGPDHPDAAQSLRNLAIFYSNHRRYKQAEPLYLRALDICERVLGPDHPDTAQSLRNLAFFYEKRRRYKQAESLYLRALAIRERVLGPDHPDTAESLHYLAWFYHDRHKYKQAEPLYERALAIREQVLGPNHPDTVASLIELAINDLYRGKLLRASKLFIRTIKARFKIFGILATSDHLTQDAERNPSLTTVDSITDSKSETII